MNGVSKMYSECEKMCVTEQVQGKEVQAAKCTHTHT